jgi:transposase
MCIMPRPYPREFREDVIRVARNREPGVRIKDIAADFGISESYLQNWLTQADRDEERSHPRPGGGLPGFVGRSLPAGRARDGVLCARRSWQHERRAF